MMTIIFIGVSLIIALAIFFIARRRLKKKKRNWVYEWAPRGTEWDAPYHNYDYKSYLYRYCLLTGDRQKLLVEHHYSSIGAPVIRSDGSIRWGDGPCRVHIVSDHELVEFKKMMKHRMDRKTDLKESWKEVDEAMKELEKEMGN